jgi:hypothetical protein
MSAWIKCSTPMGVDFVNFELIVAIRSDVDKPGSVLVLPHGGTLTVNERPEELVKLAQLAH